MKFIKHDAQLIPKGTAMVVQTGWKPYPTYSIVIAVEDLVNTPKTSLGYADNSGYPIYVGQYSDGVQEWRGLSKSDIVEVIGDGFASVDDIPEYWQVTYRAINMLALKMSP